MVKTNHYWTIHRKVSRRLLNDLPTQSVAIIAADTEHETELYKWFEAKVHADTLRLYEDVSYYMNQPETFKYQN